MCGIAGYVGYKELPEDSIQNTLKLMTHRGPNGQRFSRLSGENFRAVLLHSRLSILDLASRSDQPFVIDDYHLIFNGEIYNYMEVREKLQKEGVEFTTSSDTEVLLRSYIFYGESCVDHFEGMWSFCIFDTKQQLVFLSRDRFAEKPLYYIKDEHGLWFASEIKFLKSLRNKPLEMNIQQALRYLINGYKSIYKTGDTFFHEVCELPYATNMIIDHELVVNTKQYWYPEYNPQEMSLQEAIAGTRDRLLRSMQIRLRSDVPVAFCLSGGVDSATLASIASKEFAQKISTFSIIDSDERYNEYDLINATVNDTGADAHFIHISQENVLQKLCELVDYHDAPIATISYYIHSLLSETISKNGFKVVFSGTAADELFTGYYDHYLLHLYEMRNHPQFSRYVEEWQKNVCGYVRNPYLQNPQLFIDDPQMRDHIYFKSDEFSSYLYEEFTEGFTETLYCNTSLLRNRMLNELFHEATRVILHEDDLNSMKYSIENRSPYLDKELFEFAYSIPPEHLINKGYNKYVLREAAAGILNDQVRLERQKKGFNASITSLVDFSDPQTREFLLDERAIVFSIVKRDKIATLFQMSSIPNSYSKFLFNFINLRIFLGT